VIDNLRLLPQAPPALARFELKYPNYRNWIFPDGPDIEVSCTVQAHQHGLNQDELSLQLTLQSEEGKASSYRGFKHSTARTAVSSAGLAPGNYTLKAGLRGRGGREFVSQSWPVRRLSEEEVRNLKSYVDAANTFHVDGAPFFPIGWYGSVNTQHLAEIAGSPFNCLLAYGTDTTPKSEMVPFLDALQAKGLKLVYCLNDVYPTAEYFAHKTWEGIEGNDAIAAAVVKAYRDHPAIIAWYLNDEIPHKLVPQLTDYYARIKQADPSRADFIVLCNRSELPYFPDTTDIFGVDPYPIPHDPITRVSSFVDAARAAVKDRQSVWLVPQAFAWYQYNSKNPDRGHTPTPEELRSGRAPSYEEGRCMTYLGLIHGAKGLIYYCYYDLRVLPQYAEMWGWMKSIASEVRELTPALVSAEASPVCQAEPPDLHATVRKVGNRYYLLAANPGAVAQNAKFKIKGAGSRGASVLFENRSVQLKHGNLQDTFLPLAVHVYSWSE